MNKYYAGIGSRQITPKIKNDMMTLAGELEKMGYTLRSGNATGSDQAFASGTSKAQIWLPWMGFEKEFTDQFPNHVYRLVGDECCPGEPDPEAWDSVEKFHPNYKNMENGDANKFMKFMRFMSRNYRQVIGWGEPNSEFVICWTDGGGEKGGTGQALRIAKHYDIPIYNLFNMTKDDVLKEINKLNLLY